MRAGPQHPAIKLRELTTRLAKEFNVRVAYYHDNLQLRFGERPLANDWLRLARRIARQVRFFLLLPVISALHRVSVGASACLAFYLSPI
jgi:hypothetical protein